MSISLEQLLSKARELEKNSELIKKIEEGKRQLKIFLEKYPFREKPEMIDSLTPEKIYNPGSDDYFFLWIEFKTRSLGAISVYGKYYNNAIEKIDKFKQLLKIIVDESIPLREKVDYDCGIPGFRGDRLITKKIIYCYFSDEIIPIFLTEDLKDFCQKLNLNYEKESLSTYNKPFEDLTVGEKYELLNGMLLKFKAKHFPSWDNALFMIFLYKTFPREEGPYIEAIPLYKYGLLFEPRTEQEVVYLFSQLHRKLGFPYIVQFQETFPDVIVLDANRQLKKIEIEKLASDFEKHGHSPENCDFIICWENDLKEIPEKFPKIISLKEYITEYES
jgi:hypothetical protein